MNEKLSLQNLADSLSQNAGVSKKVSETFSKAFFDTIVEALYMGESSIKIKGLGVFKLIEVESRESVNVSNGERILIPGYKKVSFVPDDEIVDVLNKDAEVEHEEENGEKEMQEVVEKKTENAKKEKEEESAEKEISASLPAVPLMGSVQVEEVEIEKIVDEKEPEMPSIDELIQVEVPERVEMPADELSGIDMLISTPESVEEVRAQFEEAKAKADAIIEEARKANAEKVRLEKLLARLETNEKPELAEVNNIGDAESACKDEETNISDNQDETTTDSLYVKPSESTSTNDDAKQNESLTTNQLGALSRLSITPSDDDDEDEEPWYKRGKVWCVIVPLILVLVGCIAYFLHKTHLSIDAVENVVEAEVVQQGTTVSEPAKPIVVPSQNDSIETENKDALNATEQQKADGQKDQPSAEVKKEEPKPQDAEPAIPSVYIMKKGESLTRISQRFYGTKDSVNAIIRLNRFSDPNNVPIGARIYLP